MTETHPAALPSDHGGLVDAQRTKYASKRNYDRYGVDADDPESAIAATIDSGTQAHRIMTALVDLGYVVIKAEALAALGRVQPVAWQRFSEQLGWTVVDADYAQVLQAGGEKVRPLYATPPAPQPALNTKISAETQAALDAIDDNIRAAAVAGSTMFVGSPQPALALIEDGAAHYLETHGDVLVRALMTVSDKMGDPEWSGEFAEANSLYWTHEINALKAALASAKRFKGE